MASVPLPTHLTLTRDKHGRFRPKAAPPPGTDPQAQLLEDAGITPKMQRAALAEYIPPDDPHDKDQLERRLREYIVANLGTWVNGRHCNLQMVFAALKDSYAIDQKYYTTLLAAARAARAQAALGGAGGPARESMAGTVARPTGTRVRPGQRVLTYRLPVPGHGARAFCPPAAEQHSAAFEQNVPASVGEGLAPSRSANVMHAADTWVGAGPASARGEQSNGFVFHRDTEATEQAELGSSSHLTHPTLSLGGENTADTATTAGGRKALSYNAGRVVTSATDGGKDAAATVGDSDSLRLGALAVEILPNAATCLQPLPLDLEPARPPPHMHILQPP